MRGKWKIEDRYPLQSKIGSIDFGIATGFNINLVSGKQPFWTRQLASGYGSIRDDVIVRPGLFNQASVKKEWVWAGQDIAVVAQLHADSPGHVLELAAFALQVVGAASGFDMFIARAAFEHEVAFGLGLSGIFVVGNLVGGECVHAIQNPDLALQLVDRAVFLLFYGLNGHWN